MSVLELCDPEAAAVPVEASVSDAIKKMLDFHVGAVAIVDSERRVAGIFTERDVLRKFSLSGRDPAQTPVRELMTTPVELATSQTGPGEALITMVERHFRHLPVRVKPSMVGQQFPHASWFLFDLPKQVMGLLADIVHGEAIVLHHDRPWR